MIDRLTEDHARATRLAEGLQGIDGVSADPEIVQTNILVFQVDPRLDQTEVVEAFKTSGLLVSNYGAVGLRMVTHNDIGDADVSRALDIVAATVPAMLAGRRDRAAD
jgi:threonine aldolase